jgi:hypothetical protein
MSEEFPVKRRKIGKLEIELLGFSLDGSVGYKIGTKIKENQIGVLLTYCWWDEKIKNY